MKLVLHVGPHKTATTYLQTNFRRQSSELLKRGWLYPAAGVRTGTAHHDIADAAHEIVAGAGPTFDSVRAMARKAQARNLDVLLSAEGFRRWRPRDVDALTELFGSPDLRLVYVLRDPMTVLRSMWSQSVKLGSTDGLDAFLKRHLRKDRESRLLNPLKDLDPHLARKRTDFTILLYDEIERQGLDIYATFMREALSIEEARPIAGPANPRPELEITEFLRLISVSGGYVSREGRVDVGDAVKHLFSPDEQQAIVSTIREQGSGARRTIEISRDTGLYEDLELRLRASAEAHFRPLPDGARLFPTHQETWTYYDAHALLKAEPVAKLVENASKRLKSSGFRVAVMNQGFRALKAGRRLRNLISARIG